MRIKFNASKQGTLGARKRIAIREQNESGKPAPHVGRHDRILEVE